MTRNRNRKDQARQLQRETGTRHAAASRAHDTLKQRAQPVQGMLAGAAGAVAGADPADAAAFLRAAWQAVCVIGAAAELLAECAGTRDYRGRFHVAGEPLRDAVDATRDACPAECALRGQPGGKPRRSAQRARRGPDPRSHRHHVRRARLRNQPGAVWHPVGERGPRLPGRRSVRASDRRHLPASGHATGR